MNWGRASSIARKEVAHIVRDPFTLALALVLPVFMVLIFGVAMEFNVKEIPMALLDSDQSARSRELVESFTSSNYFKARGVRSSVEGVSELQGEKARALLVIPPQFQKDLQSGRGAKIQILIDGADNSTVSSIGGYLGDIQQRAQPKLLGITSVPPFEMRTRFLFNEELNSKWFVVPGLVVVVMSILSILLTALTVAREWENGSMELLLSTPVQPSEIIVGKLAPYAALGLGAVGLVYVIARLVFSVPFTGNHLVFLLGCILFLITYLAQGLLISVTARQQQVAMQFAMLSGLLPSQLLSGFIFPVESMPKFFQILTMVIPARWFMEISRQCFLQGSSLWEMKWDFIALIIIGSTMLTIAVRKFKRDVEP